MGGTEPSRGTGASWTVPQEPDLGAPILLRYTQETGRDLPHLRDRKAETEKKRKTGRVREERSGEEWWRVRGGFRVLVVAGPAPMSTSSIAWATGQETSEPGKRSWFKPAIFLSLGWFSVALDRVNKPVSPSGHSRPITSVPWAQLLTSQVPSFPSGSLPIQPAQK